MVAVLQCACVYHSVCVCVCTTPSTLCIKMCCVILQHSPLGPRRHYTVCGWVFASLFVRCLCLNTKKICTYFELSECASMSESFVSQGAAQFRRNSGKSCCKTRSHKTVCACSYMLHSDNAVAHREQIETFSENTFLPLASQGVASFVLKKHK